MEWARQMLLGFKGVTTYATTKIELVFGVRILRNEAS